VRGSKCHDPGCQHLAYRHGFQATGNPKYSRNPPLSLKVLPVGDLSTPTRWKPRRRSAADPKPKTSPSDSFALSKNVKNWKNGTIVQRNLDAEQIAHRIAGYRENESKTAPYCVSQI